jgi:hypothetical protein
MRQLPRGWRIVLGGSGVVLLVLVVAWLSIPWDGPVYDDSRLHVREEPFTEADNGWPLWKRAALAVQLDKARRDGFKHLLFRGDPRSAEADSALARLEVVMPLVRQALARPRCVGPATRSLADTVEFVLPQHDLGLLLCLRAARLARQERDAEALGALEEALGFVHRFERDASEFPQHGLGWLGISMALRTCRILQDGLRLTAAQELALAGLLLATEPDATGFRRMARHQYNLSAQLVDSLAAQTRSPLGWGEGMPAWLRRLTVLRLFHPQDTKRELARLWDLRVQEADSPLAGRGVAAAELQEHKRLLDERRNLGLVTTPNVLGSFFIALHAVDLSAVERFRCACLAEQRLAAAVSTLRATRLKTGRWPADWREAGIAAPLDPFDGALLRWDPARQIVYSVGANLRDDGGSEAPTDSLTGWPARDLTRREDIVRHLERRDPSPDAKREVRP